MGVDPLNAQIFRADTRRWHPMRERIGDAHACRKRGTFKNVRVLTMRFGDPIKSAVEI
jgi:hypothetical protein